MFIIDISSLRDLNELIHSMQDLVSLAVHRGAAVLWVQFFLPPSDRDRPEVYPVRPRRVDVYQRRQVVGDPVGRSDSYILQHLRAVLQCEVRVTVTSHPM